ncbi:MAG: OB-fold nucleic acid binding domain-containing protein [Candidatus Atabeyarchaeum deiterrae]
MNRLPRVALDEIVSRIVEEKGLSRKQVFELIDKKKSTLSWMISDEGAADLVAKELGVEIYPDLDDEDLSLTIGDLVTGMSNVTITGRVMRVNPVREYTDRNGNKGFVTDLVIADKSGEAKTVLWGEATSFVQTNNVNEGSIVRIHDGYVKEDLGEKIELHVGRRGRIEINPHDTRESDFPPDLARSMKVNELRPEMREVNVKGLVQRVFGTRSVRTKEGREVRLSSLIIGDETGASARVVFWDDKTSLVENARIGDIMEIRSGQARLNRNGGIEIHINASSAVKMVPSVTAVVGTTGIEKAKGIIESERRTRGVALEGLIADEPLLREFTRSNGVKGKILSFILADNTSSIRVVAWDEDAENLRELRKGDSIAIREGNIRRGINAEVEVHIRDSNLVTVKNGIERIALADRGLRYDLARVEDRDNRVHRKKIVELKDGEVAEIRGLITKVQDRPLVYMACPKCFRKVDKKEEKWLCIEHGSIDTPMPRVLYSLTLDDGTAIVKCTLSGKIGEELLDMRADELLSGIEGNTKENASMLSNVLGTDVILVGRCSLNQKLNRSELRVIRIVKPDPRIEARSLLEHIRNEFII